MWNISEKLFPFGIRHVIPIAKPDDFIDYLAAYESVGGQDTYG